MRYVYQECNKVAYKLVSMAFSLSIDAFHIWPSPSSDVVKLLSQNAMGVKWPRRVSFRSYCVVGVIPSI